METLMKATDITVTAVKGEPVRAGRRDAGGPYTVTPVTYTLTADGVDHTFPCVLYAGNVRDTCGRCYDYSGSKPEFAGIYQGVCFECRGIGFTKNLGGEEQAVKRLKQRLLGRVRAAAKRDAKWAAKRAAAEAEFDAWLAANPALPGRLAPHAARDDGPLAAAAAEVAAGRVPNVDPDRLTEWLNTWDAKEAEEEARRAAARYAGPVGAKVDVVGTVAFAKYIEPRQYGWSASMLLVVKGVGDDTGVEVKTFGTGRTLFAVERGDTVRITGTVKEHAEYQHFPQTVLTRATVDRLEAMQEVTA